VLVHEVDREAVFAQDMCDRSFVAARLVRRRAVCSSLRAHVASFERSIDASEGKRMRDVRNADNHGDDVVRASKVRVQIPVLSLLC
jgi:hypothetical protein